MEFVGGQEMRWCGAGNRVGIGEAGRRGQTGASEDRTMSHREKEASANHARITSKHTHTHLQLMREDGTADWPGGAS